MMNIMIMIPRIISSASPRFVSTEVSFFAFLGFFAFGVVAARDEKQRKASRMLLQVRRQPRAPTSLMGHDDVNDD